MTNFERFKQALKRRDEERFAELKKEIKKMEASIEKVLTMFFETTTSKTQTNYSGTMMY